MSALTGSDTGTALPPRPLGVGVLGCADIAGRRFLPALAGSRRARLVAVAGRDRERCGTLARLHGAAVMTYRELLASPVIDLIYLPLPNHLHEEWGLSVLNAGKHLLCEKPLGLSAASVDRLVDTAERNGVLLYENLMYLRHPQHRFVRRQLAAGRIGAVTGLRCVFTIPGPAPGDFRWDPRQGGGAFHDLNRYPLSAAGFFLRGTLDRVIRCRTVRRKEMILAMEGEAVTVTGERFTFDIAFGRPYSSFYELTGTGGTLRLERAFTPPADHRCRLEIRGGGRDETLFMPARDHFQLTLDHVAALIAAGTGFAREHERWRLLARIADCFLEQAEAGKESP